MFRTVTSFFASVDLGGTKIACAIGGRDGVLMAETSTPTRAEQGPPAVLDRIAETVLALAAQSGARPLALGMGVPGLVDRARGETLFLPNLPTQWRGVAAAAAIESRVGCGLPPWAS